MSEVYVLIDFENVQPKHLGILKESAVKVLVFVGANQQKLSFEIVEVLHQLGERVRYIKIAGSGHNALDFHIAYHMGQLAHADPKSTFYVISKDKGFDPLLQHLTSNGVTAHRLFDVQEMHTSSAVRPTWNGEITNIEERTEAVIERIKRMNSCRPKARKGLKNVISTVDSSLLDTHIEMIIDRLSAMGYLAIEHEEIQYNSVILQ